MGNIKMGIGLGLWHHGMPDAATLFEYIDKAEAWGMDSVWLSDHFMGARLAYYAQDIAPYFEPRAVPLATP